MLIVKNTLKIALASAFAISAVIGIAPNMEIGAAYAQEGDSAPTLAPAVAKEVGPAYEDIQNDRHDQAIQKLSRILERRPDMKPYDKSTVLELRAIARIQKATPDTNGALRDFEEVLRIGGLPAERLRTIRFNLAGLYFQDERYDDTIRFLQDYIRSATDPITSNTYYILAASYYQSGQVSSAVRPAQRAIDLQNPPKRGYYDLLNVIYSDQNNNSARGDLLVKMINYWPEDASLWNQLSGAYYQAEREGDAVAALELAYKSGLLTKAEDVVRLAQFYSSLDNPYRGAKLLEREMASGKVEQSRKNLELQAQLWSGSREHEKSAATLLKIANRFKDAEVLFRLGQAYVASSEPVKAEKYLNEALAMGGLKPAYTGDALLLLADIYYNQTSNDDPAKACAARDRARATYNRAARYPSARRNANSWLGYINSLEESEKNARKIEAALEENEFKKQQERCVIMISNSEQGLSVDAGDLKTCREFMTENPVGTKFVSKINMDICKPKFQ